MSVQDFPHCSYCMNAELPCDECQKWKERYHLQHQSLFYYNDWMKAWLNQYKIQGDYRLRSCFAYDLYQALYPYVKRNYILVPIPIDEYKYYERGFNQVAALLEAAELPYEMWLSKRLLLQAQGLKTREERLKTPQPFRCQTVKVDRKVILIDDIYTTGRTLTHAYGCLQEAGVQHITSFSLIRAGGEHLVR